MEDYKLKQSGDTFCLLIFNNRQVGCSLLFLGGVGIFMFLMPILVIVFIIKELSFGVVMSGLLAWLIAGYFVKLYLWNRYGKEVFIIKKKKIEVYNDYKYFKENHKCYLFSDLCITYFIGTEAFFAVEKSKNIDKDQLSKIGFQLDREVITSHRELSIGKIIEIAKQINNKNSSTSISERVY